MPLAKKYIALEVEEAIQKFWEEKNFFAWNPGIAREDTFVVDTPPPTVSGSLHIGHVFSYTQTDIVTRYQRMKGKNIFYPIGWDDNGLPTERRVQNYFGIRCNSEIPYDPDWEVNHDFNPKKDKPIEISRRNFVEACEILTEIDEKVYEQTFKRLGLSIDWNQTYSTIDKHCQKISQASFLDLVKKGIVYNHESPTMWDVGFQSAIAQAELEDREIPGAYYDLEFGIDDSNETFIISTTRPELLPACIAVVAHPEDERYKNLFGKKAVTPLFHAPVSICPSEHADPEKGSGIMMVCTFGDIADVDWWEQSGLPIKQIIGRNGRLAEVEYGEEPFTSLKPEVSKKNYKELEGLRVKQAHRKIAELLQEEGSSVCGTKKALVSDPKPITHPVKFYEKGDLPLEFVSTRQWYIKTLDSKEKLIEQGKKIKWHPEHMFSRYENWVNGLNQDWCISRQRYFGVPFPVWYKLDEDSNPDFENPIYAESLPVDPQIEIPSGFTEDQRNQPNGFMGDPDIMDTWATSSLTPQISSHWLSDEQRHKKLFPC